MSCDVAKAKEELENDLWRRWRDGKIWEWAELILQAFRQFTYVTAHSLTLPLLHLHHSSFSNSSFASPTSLPLHLRHLASRPCCGLGITVTSHEVGSGSNLGQVNFLVEVFSGFSRNRKTNVRKFEPHSSQTFSVHSCSIWQSLINKQQQQQQSSSQVSIIQYIPWLNSIQFLILG